MEFPANWPKVVPRGTWVFRSELIGENEIRWESRGGLNGNENAIIIGQKVDYELLAFHANLTPNDRQFLASLHISTEDKSAYEKVTHA